MYKGRLKKVVIITSTYIKANPRVVKEAIFLSSIFSKVVIITNGLVTEACRSLIAEKQNIILKSMRNHQGFLSKFFGKLNTTVSRLAFSITGIVLSGIFGGYLKKLLYEARRENADLYIGHLEIGLWVSFKLHKEGKNVAIDFEDWYSEDLLPEARKLRPIAYLKELEKYLLGNSVYCLTPSKAMSEAMKKTFNCPEPHVIRNCFPRKDYQKLDCDWLDRPEMRKYSRNNQFPLERPKEAPVSIFWFSQTIGPGRGLEQLFAALTELHGDWEVHLRGNIKGYERWVEKCCPKDVLEKLKIHKPVPTFELLSRISEHDIGYAGELKEPPSRNLTITNKFFQYLQGGLAVIGNNTLGQIEGSDLTKGSVELVDINNLNSFKTILIKLINDKEYLKALKKTSYLTREYLNWENETKTYSKLLCKIE